MLDPNYFSLLRMKLAATLYDASSCEAWPWCTASECCEPVYYYLEHLGVELTREHPGSAEYVYTDFEPFEVAEVLEAIFKMAELGNLHQGDVYMSPEFKNIKMALDPKTNGLLTKWPKASQS